MIHRLLSPSRASSFFLFGARGTGKSTFLEQQFGEAFSLIVNLLQPTEFERYSVEPELLSRELEKLAPKSWVLIDEVQRVPALLDLIHYHIEKHKLYFAVSGSSARKLRRGAANLLAGRAFTNELFPLTFVELGERFNLNHALRFGTLPHLFSLPTELDQALYLQSYASTYVQEEIWNEHLIRVLPPFRKFLAVAAQMNGEIVNCSRIAGEVGVDDKTVRSYFSILEDTHLGFCLEAFDRSVRKQQVLHPKFYFFDTGVRRAVEKTVANTLREGSAEFGKAFEHYIITEITRLNSYQHSNFSFSYLRTKDDAEIDMIISKGNKPQVLLEIKSTAHVRERDVRALKQFHPQFKGCRAVCLSNDPKPQRFDSVEALPWQKYLRELFFDS